MSMPFRRWVRLILAVLLIIELVFTFVVTAHSAWAVREQALETYMSGLSVYGSMLAEKLHAVEVDLSNLAYTQTSALYQAAPGNVSNDALLARQALIRQLDQDARLSSVVDGAFVLFDDGGLLLKQYNVYAVTDQDALRSLLPGDISRASWFAEPIGARTCLVRLMPFINGALGVYVDVDHLLAELRGTGMEGVDDFRLTSSEELPDSGGMYLPVTAPIGATGFALTALLRVRALNENLYPNYLYGALFATVLTALFISIYFSVVRHAIRPFQTLARTMTRFREGDLEARAPGGSTIDEINATVAAYNDMAAEVNQLKIANYESELARNRTELQFFQLQIQPHFLINTLNTIYTLSMSHADDLIRRLTMFLVDYYRYTIVASGDLVRLRDELEHVKSYLGIHEIRLGEQLDVFYDVDESLLDAAIPPIVLQTFVENSVQYAVSMDEVTFIGIEIRRDREDENMLRITITDTGAGFPEDCLTDAPIKKEGKLHIGIHNVRERLRIAYQGRAKLVLSNTHPHGARVDIVVPIIINN